MNEPDVMTELWCVKDRLSREARQDLVAYCKRVTNEACKKGFILISSIPTRLETVSTRAVAESADSYCASPSAMTGEDRDRRNTGKF